MILDHVGVAVRSLEQAVERWRAVFGYRQETGVVTNTRQKVRVVFLGRPGSLPVKLIEPTDPSSSVYEFAQRGGGLHHLCFRCEEIDAELARLRALGLRVIAPPQPGEAFGGERIAFVYAGEGLNIELIDTLERAGRLADGDATPADADGAPAARHAR
jgi:methylmalonyl-CoA/ethylmalonyl-CoA epimerase